MESKIKNLTHNFKEMNLVLQLINKKSTFLYRLFYPKEFFLPFVFYLNVKCIEYTCRIYILFHIKKHYFTHFFACF